MARWLNLGQVLRVNTKKFRNSVALKDKERAFTYPQLNRRVNRLADSLLSLGLRKGDKVSVLMENSIEIVELYLATAKTGMVIVPINFRLAGPEVEYIVNNSDASALLVHDQFVSTVNPVKEKLRNIPSENYVVVGKAGEGYLPYKTLLEKGSEDEPDVAVDPEDPWILIYTSGTTGRPKGVLRSHESHIAFYLLNAIDFGFNEKDICLNVMPLCHINSVFYTFLFLYIGGSAYIHPAQSFNPEEIMEIVQRERITFISLIPTHYNLILNLPTREAGYDVGSIRKLLCSSAPVTKEMKKAVMDFFPGVDLYEAYGSSEAGIVTILKPEDQMKKLGSIGYEALGTDFVKVLDEEGREVDVGQPGELYSRGPTLFDGYYKMPEKTAASFRGEWFSAGDMGKKDEDGYFQIVDRKDNMIITGGEHVYPSELEKIVAAHESVFDCACIGLPDEKWGEKVVAVVIRKPGVDEKEVHEGTIKAFCKNKLARYKHPKEVIFIEPDEMPRTATGKILHRILREDLQNKNRSA